MPRLTQFLYKGKMFAYKCKRSTRNKQKRQKANESHTNIPKSEQVSSFSGTRYVVTISQKEQELFSSLRTVKDRWNLTANIRGTQTSQNIKPRRNSFVQISL